MSTPPPLSVVFMGTPQFSIPGLQALLNDERFQVLGILTQPDKPVGRGQKLTPSPVKVLAEQTGLPVKQPKRLRKDEAVMAWLRDNPADFFVTIAFGQILNEAVLSLPKFGTVNVHASLLPKGRGPNPIQQALLQGEVETGLTTMLTELGVDTGPMLLSQRLPITPTCTLSSLSEALSAMAGPLLLKTLTTYAAGTLVATPQTEALATHAPKLEKHHAHLNLNTSAETLALQVRAQNPWPGAVVLFQANPQQEPLRCHWHQVLPATPEQINTLAPSILETATPGQVLALLKQGLLVQTGRGVLLVQQLQPAGKKIMPAADWARNIIDKATLSLAYFMPIGGTFKAG